MTAAYLFMVEQSFLIKKCVFCAVAQHSNVTARIVRGLVDFLISVVLSLLMVRMEVYHQSHHFCFFFI